MHRRLLGFCLLACIWGCDRGGDESETDPPSVPLTPLVERLELGRFRLSWEHVSDDETTQADIRYDIGVVRGQYCVVPEADYSVTGDDSLAMELWDDETDNPFVGFTLRSLDEEGQSHGYGRCGWALRAPQRSPLALVGRAPSFPSQTRICQSDGSTGVWCQGRGELAHFDGTGWDVFPLPTTVELIDWVAVGETEALVRMGSVQLQLSRANGLHAYVISPSSQPFDSAGGVIRTGLERAYLSVRGMVGEFTSGHIDLAGPARALRLPDSCEKVLQMGYQESLAFALCQLETGNSIFLGRPERRLMSWADPFAVEGDRVAGISGDTEKGLLALPDDNGVTVFRWVAGETEEIRLENTAGNGPPFAAVGGHALAPFILFGHEGSLSVWSGDAVESVPLEGDQLIWNGTPIPAHSTFVGTADGVLAVSERGVARLTQWGAEWVGDANEIVRGVRALDGRHYILQGPRLEAIASTLAGHAYHFHTWRGSAMEPFDTAASASGAMYVSGWELEPDGQRRVAVAKLGSQTNVIGLGDHPEFLSAPRLAIDALGRLYAYDGRTLASYSPALSTWTTFDTAPTLDVEWLVALSESVVLMGRQAEGVGRYECTGGQCVETSVQSTRHQITTAFALDGQLCVGLSGAGLRCQNQEEILFRFSREIRQRFALSPGGAWAVIDAIPFGPERWLVAMTAGEDGLLASIDTDGTARLLGYGFHWGPGHVLVPTTNENTIVVLEENGPVGVRLRGERVSIPGRLY